jgi:outer membrane protein
MRPWPLLLILLPGLLPAQAPWTLQDCIRHARDNNLTLKQAQLNERSTELSLRQARYDLLPNLNADIGYQFNFGRVVDPTTYEFTSENIQTGSVTLSTGLTVFSGFRKMNYIKQQQLAVEASRYGTEDTYQQLSLQIAQAYLQVLLALETEKAAQEGVGLAAAQRELTQKLFLAGRVPEGSVFEADAQIARSEQTATEAANAVTLSYLNLRILLELPSDQVLRIDTAISAAPLGVLQDFDAVIGQAMSSQPVIKAAELTAQSSEKGVAAARGAYYPTVSLFAGVYSNYSNIRERIDGVTFGPIDTIGAVESTLEPVIAPSIVLLTSPYPLGQQLDDNFNQAVGVSVGIPIFNGLQARTSVELAKIESQQAQLNLQQTRNTLTNAVQQAQANAVAARSRYQASEKSLRAAREAFGYAQKRNAEGPISPYDFNAAQNNVFQAQTDFISAKYEYHFMKMILDYYAGQPLAIE